ncbi:MAG: LptF/LptG family permease [Gemmatimonadota bacterium]
MIRTLDRLVATNFLKLFLAFVAGAPILFILGDVTERIDIYMDRSVSMVDVAHAYLLQLPQFILWSFPIAALLASVFTIHSMTTHHEIVAAKAGGVSFHRLLVPMISLGVVLTGVALALTELVPDLNRRSSELLQDRDLRREWRTNFVFQSDDGYAITAQRLEIHESRLQRVLLERPAEDDASLGIHLVAEEARWDPEVGWTFRDGFLRRVGPEGEEEAAYRFQLFRFRGLAERPEHLLEEPLDHDQMTYRELGRQAEVVLRSGGDPRELLVKREEKLAIPMATLVIILFGAPLATSTKRGGAAFGVGISLASTILYLLLHRMAGAMGASGALDPQLAAWMPNGLFLLTGLFLLVRIRT